MSDPAPRRSMRQPPSSALLDSPARPCAPPAFTMTTPGPGFPRFRASSLFGEVQCSGMAFTESHCPAPRAGFTRAPVPSTGVPSAAP